MIISAVFVNCVSTLPFTPTAACFVPCWITHFSHYITGTATKWIAQKYLWTRRGIGWPNAYPTLSSTTSMYDTTITRIKRLLTKLLVFLEHTMKLPKNTDAKPFTFPQCFGHCYLGHRKDIRPIKSAIPTTDFWGSWCAVTEHVENYAS